MKRVSKSASIPRALHRAVKARARRAGLSFSAFAARAIKRDLQRSKDLALTSDESDRLTILAGKLGASEAAVLRAVIRNALGFEFRTRSLQYRVIDASAEVEWS
jgi:hypothetical protein